jgi:hypothetical protein
MAQTKRIVLVGQCGIDAYKLQKTLEQVLGDRDIDIVESPQQDGLADVRAADALWLVNRKLPAGDFSTDNGVELIRSEKKPDGPKLMLISDLADAQSDAAQAGALPGFGKGQLFDPIVPERLNAAIDG